MYIYICQLLKESAPFTLLELAKRPKKRESFLFLDVCVCVCVNLKPESWETDSLASNLGKAQRSTKLFVYFF